nr:MAG TPA: hypothetical protein [Caudoviricetes sp.]
MSYVSYVFLTSYIKKTTIYNNIYKRKILIHKTDKWP